MNDLVQLPSTNTSVAMPLPDMSGLDDIRIKPTNIKQVQPMTREPGTARQGQFLDELTGDVYDEIVVVPLRISFPRVKYVEGAGLGTDPECRSNDGVVPSPFAKAPQAKTCAKCKHGVWTNGKRPSCKESIRLLVIVKETGLPRYFQVAGMGIRPTRQLFEQIKQDMSISLKKGTKYHLHDYYFTIKSDKIVGEKGVIYMPRYADVRKVSDPGQFGPLFEEYVLRSKSQEEFEEGVAKDETITDKTGDAFDANTIDAEAVEV